MLADFEGKYNISENENNYQKFDYSKDDSDDWDVDTEDTEDICGRTSIKIHKIQTLLL